MKSLLLILLVAFIATIQGKPAPGGVNTLTVPVVYHDFVNWKYAGSVLPGLTPVPFIDFGNKQGSDTGIVKSTLDPTTRLPQYNGNPTTPTTSGAQNFGYWFTDGNQYGQRVDDSLTLTWNTSTDAWERRSFRDFFPLDGKGWGDSLAAGDTTLHNFGFSAIIRFSFTFWEKGWISVQAEDDYFIFINNQLAVNDGGTHVVLNSNISLTALPNGLPALNKGDTVKVDIFYCERHTPWATFDLRVSFNAVEAVGAGDPHFTGLQGEHFDVMGEPNKWFNILSDTNMQLNALFVQGCESKPNVTAMGSIGMLVGGHRLHFDITCNATLDDSISLLEVGSVTPIGENGEFGYVHHIHPQVYFIDTPTYAIRLNPFIIDPSYQKVGMPFYGKDCIKGYFNLNVHAKDGANPTAHGILGQTHVHSHESNLIGSHFQGEGEIEGVYTDYEVSSMYATDDKFNRYTFDGTVAPYVPPTPEVHKRVVAKMQTADPSKSSYWQLVHFMETQCSN